MLRRARDWLRSKVQFSPVTASDNSSAETENQKTDQAVVKKSSKLTFTELVDKKRRTVTSKKLIGNGYEFRTTLESHKSPSMVEDIVLSNTLVEYIPVTIGRFINLQTLRLKNNAIMEMPWSVIYLKNLEILDLSQNSLTEIPPIIGYLVSLKELVLVDNKLTFLPTSLLKLTKLAVLSLKGNPQMDSPPLSICLEGKDAIFSELMRRHDRVNVLAGSTPWYSEDKTEKATYRRGRSASGVDTLMKIAIDSILECQIDYLSPVHVPPPLKTFLQTTEDTRAKQIQISACSACKSFFSTEMLFEVHHCRMRDEASSTI